MIKQRPPAPTRRRSAGGLTGYVGALANQYIEVVQSAVRTQWNGPAGRYEHYLDVVVRNNAHVGGAGTGFSHWTVYASVASP
jgi:hypothetical protein